MNVFTYGSLMYERVWRRVVSGEYAAQTGVICGFSRQRIRGESHPALLRGPTSSTVTGLLYRDVSPEDLAALDAFEAEGEAYVRITTPVRLESGEEVNAWTYLYLHREQVEGSPWDPERFAAEGLEHFLANYCQDRER